MSERASEKGLIEKTLKGDQRAFMELVSPYRSRLIRKAVSMLGNPQDAEDILQEALVTAYRALKSFRGESGIYTWLYRIVVNKCRDFHRSKKNAPSDSLDAVAFMIHDDRIDLEKNLELSTESTYLIQQINTLDKRYREILVMRYFDDLSYQEIASVLKIQVGTVKSRLFKARELLKRAILQDGKGTEFFEQAQ
ncbi:MAG TPA: RNA polymerase subunit sigma-70 [Leptospiraceae bacterium]|nr:RNA polymerase subunit sigma-70 [Spirochaetaceae bacterium]HBS05052.1 RNA polymerase subunit sigma-70 [Leptospiraceae bacterium]|tara:strand:- start:350 stop:931 length:582 start_codon:yes stop_codon:yes gene_type:complete